MSIAMRCSTEDVIKYLDPHANLPKRRLKNTHLSVMNMMQHEVEEQENIDVNTTVTLSSASIVSEDNEDLIVQQLEELHLHHHHSEDEAVLMEA